MSFRAIRPYEMTVWSLKDRFMATLKAPGVENKGHIEEPEMSLKLDGTQELNFKVPMYYRSKGQLVENPFWYDLKHGLLMVGMRKIKVIFNKATDDEEVYEFLVTEVTEQHADDGSLYCEVKGSGLAFQELGKRGYKIALSYDLLDLEEEMVGTIINNNINYWCDKVFANTDWEYEIEMDWLSYDGYCLLKLDDTSNGAAPYVSIAIVDRAHLYGTLADDPNSIDLDEIGSGILGIMRLNSGHLGWLTSKKYQKSNVIIPYRDIPEGDRTTINDFRESLGLRRNDKIYEDDYVSSWTVTDEDLIPDGYEAFKEKLRVIDASESNIYNITQNIAETFGVYCRYKYYYDDNYHIIRKKVIFYNTFVSELDGLIDFTYGYDAESISREMDSNDLCTKLIVNTVDDETLGTLSITETTANRSGEDYILNFDYMLETGAIDPDQYAEISKHEHTLAKLNREIIELSQIVTKDYEEMKGLEVAVPLEQSNITYAQEQISEAVSGIKALTQNETGTIERKGVVCIPQLGSGNNSNQYYVELTEKGVLIESIVFYKTETDFNNNKPISNSKLTFTRQSDGSVRAQWFSSDQVDTQSMKVSYKYRPQTQYLNVIQEYRQKLLTATEQYKTDSQRLTEIQKEYEEKNKEYQDKLAEKEALIADFEIMMGPALREGTWKPEEYDDLYSSQDTTFTLTDVATDSETEDYARFFWDDELFDGEFKNYEELGVNLSKQYYPFIWVTNRIWGKIKDYLNTKIVNDISASNDDSTESAAKPILWFKYEQAFERVLEYKKEGSNQTCTLKDGTKLSASSATALDQKVLEYGLKLYLRKDKIDLKTVPESTKTMICQAYGLPYVVNQLLALNSTLVPGFVCDNDDNGKVKPVLFITDVSKITVSNNTGEEYYNDLYKALSNGAELVKTSIVGIDNTDTSQKTYSGFELEGIESVDWYTDYSNVKIDQQIEQVALLDNGATHKDLISTGASAKNDSTLPRYQIVYPRIEVNSLSFNDNDITIKINDSESALNKYTDYDVLVRDGRYYITVHPINLINYEIINNNPYLRDSIQIQFKISNAELSMYLDALEVSKTNAFPQVSYELDISQFNEKFMKIAYTQLGRIAHINDWELKFENVLGYISGLTLKLDQPWTDKIEIKNYKTKFEDLFTKIIATTQSMQANMDLYNRAAGAFTSTGTIDPNILFNSLNSSGFYLSLLNGALTITNNNGIVAQNDDGVVIMNGNGIFSGSDHDENGNFILQNIISPFGLNASYLNTGSIDTNLIRIYAGDNLRFQMNALGLYAYKQSETGQYDPTQYVVHNSEGLFLTCETGANVGDRVLTETVNRVEVSWDGIIIRNFENEKVFYADNNGNLTLSGTIQARAGQIGGWNINSSGLVSIINNDLNKTAGVASGPLPDQTNIIYQNGDDLIYKVFWANSDTYGNSKFYVDSNGQVFADSVVVNESLVAEHITLNGVPLEDVLPEVFNAEDGITITALDGNYFDRYLNGDLSESVLEFSITGHNVDLNSDGFKFYYLPEVTTTAATKDDNGEDAIATTVSQGSRIELSTTTNIAFLNTAGRRYLTFVAKYGIISEIYEAAKQQDDTFELPSVLTIYVDYTTTVDEGTVTYTDSFTIGTNQLDWNLNIVRITYDSYAPSFTDGKTQKENGDADSITLTAEAYLNNVIVDENLTYQWYQKGSDGQSTPLMLQEITGATSSTYNVTYKDLAGKKQQTYVCQVTFKGSDGASDSSATGEIVVENHISSLICVITSSAGDNWLKARDATGVYTTLTCELYHSDGMADADQYEYQWSKNDTVLQNDDDGWSSSNKLNITQKDIDPTLLVFTCTVREKKNDKNEEDHIVTSAQITFDCSAKKWMEWDNDKGLWIGEDTTKARTLTSSNGFYIYTPTSSPLSDAESVQTASFTSSYAMVQALKINTLMALPSKNFTSRGLGWVWQKRNDGQPFLQFTEDDIFIDGQNDISNNIDDQTARDDINIAGKAYYTDNTFSFQLEDDSKENSVLYNSIDPISDELTIEYTALLHLTIINAPVGCSVVFTRINPTKTSDLNDSFTILNISNMSFLFFSDYVEDLRNTSNENGALPQRSDDECWCGLMDKEEQNASCKWELKILNSNNKIIGGALEFTLYSSFAKDEEEITDESEFIEEK